MLITNTFFEIRRWLDFIEHIFDLLSKFFVKSYDCFAIIHKLLCFIMVISLIWAGMYFLCLTLLSGSIDYYKSTFRFVKNIRILLKAYVWNDTKKYLFYYLIHITFYVNNQQHYYLSVSGTKIDLRDPNDPEQITSAEGKQMHKKMKTDRYVECSSKLMENVSKVFAEAMAAYIFSPKRTKKSSGCVFL